MSTITQPKEYTEANFKTLKGTQAIRVRPTMYIGGIGAYGMLKLFAEIYTNAIDEYNVGRVKNIIIHIDTHKNEFIVEDDGVGIPLGAVYEAATEIHSGAKFDENDGAYNYSAGMNGVGLTATNALSNPCIIEVRRDGKRVVYHFEKGIKTNYTEEVWSGPTGTIVKWYPDVEVLKEIHVNKHLYIETVWAMACISAGVRVHMSIDGEKHEVYSAKGIEDLIARRMKESHISPLVPIIRIGGKENEMEIDVAMTFSSSINSETVYSYVNSLRTAEHGEHVSGLRAALTLVMKKFIDKGDYIPKNAKFEVTGDDVRENLVAIVSAKHSAPYFDGQTKEKFTSLDYTPFARSVVAKAFNDWVNQNKDEADKIAKMIVRLAKAKAAARDVKNSIVKAGGSKNNLLDKVDPDKFKDCKSKKGEECELFIVEGDSAGGSAQVARNTHTQALYYLRGKIQNVLQGGKILSDELLQLIEVLGCGFGDAFNIDKLRFHKIIFLTDADDDGGHITALLTGFFYKHYFELIRRGHIYVGKPPLFMIKSKKNCLYIANHEHYEFVMREIALKTFNLIDPKGRKLSEDLFRVYLDKIRGYKEMVDQFAIQISVNPELIELIVRNMEGLSKGQTKEFARFGYQVKICEKDKDYVLIDFDRGYEHAFLKLDVNFYENIYKPIFLKLGQIYLANVRLQGIASQKIYGGTTYELCSLIAGTIRGKNVTVKRFKGLGEMNPEQLKVTAMDEATRNIVQLKLGDNDVAKDWMNVLLGKGEGDRKKEMFISTGGTPDVA
jgi:DNA gyrase subunit B